MIVTGWAASIPRYCTCDSANTQQGTPSTPDTRKAIDGCCPFEGIIGDYCNHSCHISTPDNKEIGWEEDTKRETVRLDIVEKRVAELQKYLHDWAIIEPEITLILGNVRRQLIEVYKEAEVGAVLRDGRYRIGFQAGMEAMKHMAIDWCSQHCDADTINCSIGLEALPLTETEK